MAVYDSIQVILKKTYKYLFHFKKIVSLYFALVVKYLRNLCLLYCMKVYAECKTLNQEIF